MPDYAFAFVEAVLQVTSPGMALQSVSYATGLSIDEEPIVLEDNTIAMRRVRLGVDSVWVTDDIKTVREHRAGNFTVNVTWTNEDDGRLRSEVLQNARLVGTSGQGQSGGIQTWRLNFEGLAR